VKTVSGKVVMHPLA